MGVGVYNEKCVFSAHAEVVPMTGSHSEAPARILRARGGSSALFKAKLSLQGYSPRTRR